MGARLDCPTERARDAEDEGEPRGAIRRGGASLTHRAHFSRSLLARRTIFVTRGYLGRIPTLELRPGRVWARHATRRGLLDLDDDGDVLPTKPSRDTEGGARRGALSKEPWSKE